MPIDWDTQLLAQCHAAFGVPVVYYPGAGIPVTVTGVFTDQYREDTFQNDTSVATDTPMVNIRASVLPAEPCQGELIRVAGILYAVTNVEADGLGDLKIFLRAATDAEAARKRAAG